MMSKINNKIKILAVVGPTSTGKSDVAIWLAKKFGGEVISADSRQVYRSMDLGTGKVTKREMSGVSHYLLDVASPKKVFTVVDYKRLANKAIEKILAKKRLPIICGGTGFYIRSIVDDLDIPDVPPNLKLRKGLVKKSAGELFKILKRLDPRRAKDIDKNNPVRLIRAIEIAEALGSVPKLGRDGNKNYDFLQIGLTLDKEGLSEKIHARLLKRLKLGMIAEVKKLKESGVSWQRLHDLGLEYRFVSEYLRGNMTKDDMLAKLEVAIMQYAKRQMFWFKSDKRIKWFDPKDRKGIEEAVIEYLYAK